MQLTEIKVYESPKVEVFELSGSFSVLENLSLQGDVTDMQDGGDLELGDLTSPW